MNTRSKFLILLIGSTLFTCTQMEKKTDIEAVKKEIIDLEAAFNNMAAKLGLKEAFLAFAAEDAVLNRQGKIVRGKKEIAAYFDNQSLQEVSLTWEPEFVDVAKSGDLGYTYGPYSFTAKDSTGQEIKANGIFHTVWKKQADGSWKYVYD